MQIDRETMETVTDLIFLGSKITADGDCSHENKRPLPFGRKAMANLDSILKSRHYFANRGPSNQSHGFSSSHVWMWELDHKESWALKNCCFWTVVLEKTLESPLDCKEIQPVNPQGNLSWIFIGRIDVEAEAPILLAIWWEEVTHYKRPWCWERLKAGREWSDKGLDGWMVLPTRWTGVWAGFRSWWWTGSLVCCSPWGCKESDTAERLNWTEPCHCFIK